MPFHLRPTTTEQNCPARSLASHQGMALLMALLAIALLSTLTLQLIGTVRGQRHESAAFVARVRLDALLLSGLNLVRAALLSDRRLNTGDTLQDPWALLTGQEMEEMLATGLLSIQVKDLSGRLQVNALTGGAKGGAAERRKQEQRQRDLWTRLLQSGRFASLSEDDVSTLLDSLADWLDDDDTPRPRGAESDWYRQNGGYACRNGTVTSLEELLLVRGMTRDLLYGGTERQPLADWITVHGSDGGININTADSDVLQALGASRREAATMEEFRQQSRNREQLGRPDWPRRLQISLPAELLRSSSEFFLVRLEGVDGIFRRQGEAVLQRDGSGNCLVLSWYLQ